MSTTFDVSVVIPAYNAGALIGEQLESLVHQTYTGPYEVIVADNGSTDDTIAVVESFVGALPTLRVVDASATRGIGFARTAGAIAARSAVIAYSDADDVASPNWLEGLMAAMEHADLVGGVLEHRTLNDPAYRVWRGEDRMEELPRPLRFLPYAVGANMAVRAHVVHEVRWSEEFPYGGDDVDFCWRAQLSGYRLAFAADAVMHYRHRTTVRGVARQAYAYGRAEPRLYARHRAAGAKRNPPATVLSSYWYVATRLPYLVMSERRRGLWFTVAAGAWGRVRESAALRVLCL